MKQKFATLFLLIASLLLPISHAQAEGSPIALDQLFKNSIEAYQDIDSLQANSSLSFKLPSGSGGLFGSDTLQAYLPLNISFQPDFGVNAHFEIFAKTPYDEQQLFLTEGYAFPDEVGYTTSNSFSTDGNQSTSSPYLWERRPFTQEDMEKLQNEWTDKIQPSMEQIYHSLYALSKDPKISKDINILEQNKVYQLHWTTGISEDFSYDDYQIFLKELEKQEVDIKELNISEEDFEELRELVAAYKIDIDLTFPKDDMVVEDMTILIEPKKANFNDGGNFLSNATFLLEIEDIQYNQELDLKRPKDGESLDFKPLKPASFDNSEALSDYREKAAQFIDAHKDDPAAVTREDIEKSFDINLDQVHQLFYSSSDRLFAVKNDDKETGITYSLAYRLEKASGFEDFSSVLQKISDQPETLLDTEKLIEDLELPEEPVALLLFSEGFGKNYFMDDSQNLLNVMYHQDKKPTVRIVTDFEGNKEKLNQETYEEVKTSAKTMEDWVDELGPFNAMMNNIEDPTLIDYAWLVDLNGFDDSLPSSKSLVITVNKNGEILETDFLDYSAR